MQKVKWIFFGYMAAVVLLVAALALSFIKAPPRDPHTYYTFTASDLRSFDPAEIDDTESAAVVGNVFETLYNYKYGVKPYELFPQLASDMPQVSADGLTMIIKLRKGIHFYDPWKKVFKDGIGPEIKARDVIFSWKRIANFQLGITANYGAMFEGRIVGLDDWWNYTQHAPKGKIDWDRPVEGWKALDDYTIQIKLTRPYPQLRYNLAHLPTAAVCRDAVEKLGDDFRKFPVGSGPFAMTEYLPEQRVVLTANPIYRGKMDVDGGAAVSPEDRIPRVQHVQLDYFSEPVPRWLLFREGYFDTSGVPRDAFSQAIGPSGDLTPEMAKDGITLRKAQLSEIFYTCFNMLDPVVGRNKPLRQAISMAFDRQKFIDVFLNGRGTPAIGLIPPGFPTFDPNHVSPYTKYDLDAARAKLREAEKINGGPIPQLQILFGDTGTQTRQEAEFFCAQMAKIGLNVRYDLRTWPRFLEMTDNKQAQIFHLGWMPDYPDEQTFLQLFYSKNAASGGVNSTAYSNPAYDKLYAKAVVMEPSPQRDALYRQMSDIISEDCPLVLEFYPIAYTLRFDWVHDVKPMEYGNGAAMGWCYLSIDGAARRAWHERHR